MLNTRITDSRVEIPTVGVRHDVMRRHRPVGARVFKEIPSKTAIESRLLQIFDNAE